MSRAVYSAYDDDPAYRRLCDELHARACSEGRESYDDPRTGFWVATRVLLLARGRCCESGCRHCPYGFRRDDD